MGISQTHTIQKARKREVVGTCDKRIMHEARKRTLWGPVVVVAIAEVVAVVVLVTFAVEQLQSLGATKSQENFVHLSRDLLSLTILTKPRGFNKFFK